MAEGIERVLKLACAQVALLPGLLPLALSPALLSAILTSAAARGCHDASWARRVRRARGEKGEGGESDWWSSGKGEGGRKEKVEGVRRRGGEEQDGG
eukprot:758166-Hanusia_phi.AAC.2